MSAVHKAPPGCPLQARTFQEQRRDECAMQAVARGPGSLAQLALSQLLDIACSASSAEQSGAAACTPDTQHPMCCLQDSSGDQQEDLPAQLGRGHPAHLQGLDRVRSAPVAARLHHSAYSLLSSAGQMPGLLWAMQQASAWDTGDSMLTRVPARTAELGCCACAPDLGQAALRDRGYRRSRQCPIVVVWSRIGAEHFEP